jgi:hypothetical protein
MNSHSHAIYSILSNDKQSPRSACPDSGWSDVILNPAAIIKMKSEKS